METAGIVEPDIVVRRKSFYVVTVCDLDTVAAVADHEIITSEVVVGHTVTVIIDRRRRGDAAIELKIASRGIVALDDDIIAIGVIAGAVRIEIVQLIGYRVGVAGHQ